ncbi:hypothetical protein MKZ38_003066 [Zalerion maritima]|uniref:FAD/NAD(P)-binding domain-containing protein n=1 Tax=Zalerion maritima TaxID=339359 RepID=A0AAD5RN20_9PEZI|nr:hypothetical protein MKZ38_003066 [Zalerion maritima]
MEQIKRFILFLRLTGAVARLAVSLGTTAIRHKLTTASKSSSFPPLGPGEEPKNVAIIGASFAGVWAARQLHGALPPGYRLVVIEPHSHFHFTWVFPRFCVLEGHEKKAFIPYYLKGVSDAHAEAAAAREPRGGDLESAEKKPNGQLRWIQGRATSLTKSSITVQLVGESEATEEVPYTHLLIATGAMSKEKSYRETGGLPSRMIENDRAAAARRMKEMQQRIKSSKRIVIVGGGAAGVELATDAATRHNITDEGSGKKIVVVHSRSAPMHRFGPRLQKAALDGLKKVGVEVVLEDRVVGDIEDGMVSLKSGKTVECDFLIDCAGQKPASSILSPLAPQCLTDSGHIKIRPTLQLDDDEFPNIYSCGDVADTKFPTPNGRSASVQAGIAAENIFSSVWGKEPTSKYVPSWVDGHIKLTLGLEDCVLHFGDENNTELLFPKKDGPTLMAEDAWRKMGAKPYEGIDDAEKPKL